MPGLATLAWAGLLAGAGLLSAVVARYFVTLRFTLEQRNAALAEACDTARISEQRLSGIFDHLNQGMVIATTQGTIERANPAAHRIFDYPPGSLTGQPLAGLGLQEAGHADVSLPLTGRSRCGASVPVEVSVSRIAQAGEPFFLLQIRDLSQRRLMERQLRESQRFLDRIIELMPVAVFVKEAQTLKFERVNRAMEELTGMPRSAFMGRTYQDFPAPDAALMEHFSREERRISAGEVQQVVHRNHLELITGARTVRGTTVALTDESGRVTHLLGVLEDLSEEIAVNQALDLEKQRAEAANRAKSEFLANVSHELRTPLNAIIGYGELLHEAASAEQRSREARDLGRIVDAGRRLVVLINEILDLANSETSHVPPAWEPVQMQRLVRELETVAEPLAAKNGNRLEIDGRVSSEFVSNERMVRTILVNLLGNAAKFTRNGTVSLRYDISADGARFEVCDSGIGIALDDQARVFEPFVQADTSASRRFAGVGLGLTLARRFCELLGGTIELNSAPDRGSAFTVTLPNTAADHSSRSGAA